MPTVQDVLQRAYLIPLALLGVYGVIVGLVMVPAVQRE
jgi:hypothetical protein